jgi:hypothetical protein
MNNLPITELGSIQILSTPSDNTNQGIVDYNATIAETVVHCDSIFLHSDGKWYLTNSNVEAEAEALQGLATADGSSEHAADVLLQGICKNANDLIYSNIGVKLYAPEVASPGEPSTSMPTTSGDFVRQLGWVIDTDTIYFAPASYHIEVQ